MRIENTGCSACRATSFSLPYYVWMFALHRQKIDIRNSCSFKRHKDTEPFRRTSVSLMQNATRDRRTSGLARVFAISSKYAVRPAIFGSQQLWLVLSTFDVLVMLPHPDKGPKKFSPHIMHSPPDVIQ